MSKISQDLIHTISDKYEGEFIDSDLCHSCGLDVFAQYQNFRGTGIVCTIGPACANIETISEMIKSGMVISRFNFSHGAHEDHKKMMDLVKEASAKVSKTVPIALALDTKGPEIRTGLNKDNATITLVKDEKVTLTTDDAHKEQSTKDKVYLDYKSLSKSINVGQIILIADGSVVLKAIEIKGDDVICTVISGASFGSRKNCCLPLVKTDLPALSSKDVSDIKFGMEQKVDIIFASFIRNADNVKEIRKLLNTTEVGKCIKIVSKIENYEGVENIEDIINESDGIMVARGDLGMDLDLEKVVVAQKKIIALCNLKGKPVICATQMVESMINSYRPTRAEIADVTNAVIDGADCVMLSGESANGKYPLQAVKTMDMICHAAESMNRTKRRFEDIVSGYITMNDSQATAMCAVSMSYKIRADGIFVLTTSGQTAHLVSMFRPRCLIFAVSRLAEVVRSCHLYRNILPLYYTDEKKSAWQEDVDARLIFAANYAIQNNYCKVGSKIVLVTGWKSGSGSSNCVRVSHITENNSIFGILCGK